MATQHYMSLKRRRLEESSCVHVLGRFLAEVGKIVARCLACQATPFSTHSGPLPSSLRQSRGLRPIGRGCQVNS